MIDPNDSEYYDADWSEPSFAPTTPELASFDGWDEFRIDRPGLADDPLTASHFDDHTPTESIVVTSHEEWASFASWDGHTDN
jgi:hypothetical protein